MLNVWQIKWKKKQNWLGHFVIEEQFVIIMNKKEGWKCFDHSVPWKLSFHLLRKIFQIAFKLKETVCVVVVAKFIAYPAWDLNLWIWHTSIRINSTINNALQALNLNVKTYKGRLTFRPSGLFARNAKRSSTSTMAPQSFLCLKHLISMKMNSFSSQKHRIYLPSAWFNAR